MDREMPRNAPTDRRTFLSRAALGSLAFTARGAFADELTRTPSQTQGPFYPDKLPLDTDNDLLVINETITPAVGEVTYLSGRILGSNGEPIRNALVEIWQADNHGAYLHSGTTNADKRDAHFQGFGRFLTGSDGEYGFRTIKPVPYPGRTPHIHFAIKSKGKAKFTTQCYIQGAPRQRPRRRAPGDPRRQGPRVGHRPLPADRRVQGRRPGRAVRYRPRLHAGGLMSGPLPDDGERMIPERSHARTFWEHVARYQFARAYAPGKRILDVACGEGYGAAGLARAGAASVIGVDVSVETCAAAARKYGIHAVVGDAHKLPLPARSVDLVVSFETIEHLARPADFLDECVRVLGPGGILIVSTPNRPVYSAEVENPHHVAELDRDEFAALLVERFESVRMFSQFPRSAAWWNPRSLASERSPWLKIKGFWRASTLICPALRPEVPEATRLAVVDVIQADPSKVSGIFNPYLVRPERRWGGEQPYYYMAVAGQPKS